MALHRRPQKACFVLGLACCQRDVKLDNVLINGKGVVKLCDFGVSIDLGEEAAAVTQCGSLPYMAPEVLRCPLKGRAEENKERRDLHYGTAADVYSLGVLMYELLVGMSPMMIDMYMLYPQFPKGVSLDAVDFVCACLNRCPALRPTTQQLLESSWLRPLDVLDMFMPAPVRVNSYKALE